MIIQGKTNLSGGQLKSYGDHRIGMMAGIAALITDSPVGLTMKCINISSYVFAHIDTLIE